MICNRADLKQFLEADRIALGCRWRLRDYLLNHVWRFQRALRRCEYYRNTHGFFLLRFFSFFRCRRLEQHLGFEILANVFGPGLSIAHPGTIVVNGGAKVGARCRLHVCVNIGTAAGRRAAAPQIGDDCNIGPGAKLFGPIMMGDNVAIGANAVVNKNFLEIDSAVGGSRGGGALRVRGMGVVIHGRARIGRHVVIAQHVTTGGRYAHRAVPVAEDDVCLGAGAKVLGPVRATKAAIVWANAVAIPDVPPGAVVGGTPALILKVAATDSVTPPRPL